MLKPKRIRSICDSCKYRLHLWLCNNTACGYMLCTNEQRGCPAESCDKYEQGDALYKSISNEDYGIKGKGIYAHNIAVSKSKKTGEYPFEQSLCDDYINGKSISALAQTYGICDTTTRKILEKNNVPVRAKGWAGRKGMNSKMANKFSDEQIKALAEDYGNGTSIDMLAVTYHISASTVSKYLRMAGAEIRPRGGNVRGKDFDINDMAYDYTNGMSVRELADKYGVSKTTVSLSLDKAGVDKRPQGFPPKKKEPAQIPAEQTQGVNDYTNPTNILPQNEEVVNTEVNSSEPLVNSSEPEVNVPELPIIPEVALRAILDKRADLIGEQKYCYQKYWEWKAAIEDVDKKMAEINDYLDRSGIDVNSLSDFPEYEPKGECYND